MQKAVLISLAAHGLAMLLVFVSVTFRQVRYIPRETYRVRLVSASVASSPPAATAPEPKPTPPAPEPPKEEPKKEELAQPVEKPKPKPQPKPAESKPQETVPRADIAKGDSSTADAGESAGESTSGAAADGISFDGGAFPYDAFVARMRHKIAAAWQVPAGSQTIERQAVIYFRVHRDGDITHVSVEQPSGVFLFDQSCQRAVIEAAPFPPLPRGYADDYLGVHFTFRFTPAQP
jgi:periplasmic protein TonB